MMREFEIERQFDIKIESIKPNKGVYFLKTDDGAKCLKKINYGTQKLLFVYGAKEHLYKSGFLNIDRYFLNKEGNPYALVNEDIYTLSQWIDGRECDFYNDDDLVIAAKNLAYMHIASKGYEPPENSKLKSDLGRWPHLIEKRIKSFDKMKEMVRKKKNHKYDFDMNYLKSVDYYKELSKKALENLNSSDYFEICRQTEENKSFCHHDYTYHNIIINDNNEVNVIDFDYCKREVRVYDISNFLIKVLKRREWDIKYANLIIDAYNSISPLEKEEYKVLYSFLLFPQRYWRLCNRYYYNEVNWIQNTFNKKMEELISEQEKFGIFIKEFSKTYNLE
ncbi:MAG: CotS family spore coat protein [Clostridium argentinense]|uniref:CotS family spore coat protein n=1 Tax=Clostridium faecium TaxID=2762223 RepID=A0ABR8YSC0_9CLOT|nr:MULTISPECIES: CotS family spore coat protein [Clostridium]MBD8047120.1 CotS family spore coat protein [Clostridium faecium]MBS5823589.1 CotS family spore coat protein [Clostridium argentinense]MDU1349606.1 CotS family spore coat protein [Clostridium argentinense]